MAYKKLKTKKPKQRTISWHKKRLWKTFTKFIKARDKNRCFTCDRVASGRRINGGHFIPSGACPPSLNFHEDNVHAQCVDCNLKLEGNHYIYGIRLGEERVAALYKIKKDCVGEVWTPEMYDEKLLYYKKKLKEYENQQ